MNDKELEELINIVDGELLDQGPGESALADLFIEIKRLREWVNDLQSGMYINCVYCGHRYGPNSDTPVTMADVLKKHIEQCPEHPLSHAKKEIKQLQKELDKYREQFYSMML